MAKIGFRLFLENEQGEVKAWNECSEEEINRFKKNTSERLGKSMSRYYSRHPNEYEKLLEAGSVHGKNTQHQL